MPITFCGQKYSKLKKKALSETMLFVDDLFPAQQKSLSADPKKYGEIKWKRPKVYRIAYWSCLSIRDDIKDNGKCSFALRCPVRKRNALFQAVYQI